MTPEHFRDFARYNTWVNRRLYTACAQLSDEDYRKDRRAFFHSIHNTLNHILIGDRIWLARLTKTEHGVKRLDEILYDDFVGLRRAREAEDARLERYVESLDGTQLASILNYKTMAGPVGALPVAVILSHLFNHQTHHRGQVHAMLTQTNVPAPQLDLLYYAMENAGQKRS
jgi:uncharacterized damage-inducible protein DinB